MFAKDFLFLSPHRDDICFSLGALAGITGGTLINLFTRSQYTPATVNEFSSAIIDEVSAVRHCEDRAFMSMCGLCEIDLRWSEAPLRGYHPFDGSDLGSELNFFETKLRRTLVALSRPRFYPKAWLFCPMAIGGHRDHLIVRDAIVRDLRKLEQRFSVAFYEDLHYASEPNRRENGINDFFQSMKASGHDGYERKALPLGRSADVKLRMIRFYESQFETPPTTLARYIPAVPGAEPHEAIWTRGELARDARWWIRLFATQFNQTNRERKRFTANKVICRWA